MHRGARPLLARAGFSACLRPFIFAVRSRKAWVLRLAHISFGHAVVAARRLLASQAFRLAVPAFILPASAAGLA